MYWKYKGQIYSKEQWEATHRGEANPEPLFTLEEMGDLLNTFREHSVGVFGFDVKKYFKSKFNIKL